MLGWISSKRLKGGAIVPCEYSQCGGYTLEAELGIEANGDAAPDFRDWEVKSHTVKNFVGLSSGPVTLMTPEPTGGYYRSEGLVSFVDRYGYRSPKVGREDRREFGGRHKANQLCRKSNLTLSLVGYDCAADELKDPSGSVSLIDSNGKVAASWRFTDLMSHWKAKHTRTAFVPCMLQRAPTRRYRYGDVVRLGMGADFLRVLQAMNSAKLFYDPGIWYSIIDGKTKSKKRSQFRMGSKSLSALYPSMETVSVCSAPDRSHQPAEGPEV